MLKNFVKLFPLRGPFDELRATLRSGDPTKKTVAKLGDLTVQINLLEPKFDALSDEKK